MVKSSDKPAVTFGKLEQIRELTAVTMYESLVSHSLGLDFTIIVRSSLFLNNKEMLYVRLLTRSFCCNALIEYSVMNLCEACKKAVPDYYPTVENVFTWENSQLTTHLPVADVWFPWASAHQTLDPLQIALATHDIDTALLPWLREQLPLCSRMQYFKAVKAGLPV